MYRIAVILLLFSSTCWCSEEVVIPDRFIGEWTGNPESCGLGTDDMQIRIGRSQITFWESEGPVLAAVVRGNHLAIIAELSGEGETWLKTAQFEITADGNTLTDSLSVPGEEILRHKCVGSG